MWFGYNPQINFSHIFRKLNLVIFGAFATVKVKKIVGTLCAQLHLQFDADSFETSQVFWSWSENMHMVWI